MLDISGGGWEVWTEEKFEEELKGRDEVVDIEYSGEHKFQAFEQTNKLVNSSMYTYYLMPISESLNICVIPKAKPNEAFSPPKNHCKME